VRELRKLKRESPDSPFVFTTERGGPFTTDSFNWLVKRTGRKAKLPFQVHAHMVRAFRRLQAGRRRSRHTFDLRSDIGPFRRNHFATFGATEQPRGSVEPEPITRVLVAVVCVRPREGDRVTRKTVRAHNPVSCG